MRAVSQTRDGMGAYLQYGFSMLFTLKPMLLKLVAVDLIFFN